MQVEASLGAQLHHGRCHQGFAVGCRPEHRPYRIDGFAARRLLPEPARVVDPSVVYDDERARRNAGGLQPALKDVGHSGWGARIRGVTHGGGSGGCQHQQHSSTEGPEAGGSAAGHRRRWMARRIAAPVYAATNAGRSSSRSDSAPTHPDGDIGYGSSTPQTR
jgi:hypothetical protein